MRTQITDSSIKLWLSAEETWNWANRPDNRWPGSVVSGYELSAEFDSNGLVGFLIDSGARPDLAPSFTEVNAITRDFLRDKLAKDHPLYQITVGQFDEKEVK